MPPEALPASLTHEVRARLARHGGEAPARDVVAALRDVAPLLGTPGLVAAAHAVMSDMSGLGPLRDLVLLPGVTDVVVNGHCDVWVDAGRGMSRVSVGWQDEDELRAFAVRLAGLAGRRLDYAQPFAEFAVGVVRCHIVIPPLADRGTCLSLRVPRTERRSVSEVCSGQPPLVVELASALVEQRIAFLVTGGTGSGKTTLLRSMLALVPHDERIVVIEDTAELDVAHPHAVTLQTRAPNAEGLGEVGLRTLVRQALRMRPDRLVVGEARGPEVVDLLSAMNSGHEGACATLHANAAADVPARIAALGMMAGLSREAVAVQFEAAVRVVVHVHRGRDGMRRVSEIAVVEPGTVRTAVSFDAVTHHYGPAWDQLQRLL